MALKRLYATDSPIDAQLLCGFLKAHAIDAQVLGDGLISLRGELPWSSEGGPGVWVRVQDFPRAADLLCDWQTASTLPDWQCRHCGEGNDGGFGACWQCGAAFAG